MEIVKVHAHTFENLLYECSRRKHLAHLSTGWAGVKPIWTFHFLLSASHL